MGIMTKPKAILFDLDDTIVADDAVNEKAWRNVSYKVVSFMGAG